MSSLPDHPMARYWNHIARDYQSETQIRLDDFHYGPLLPGNKHLNLLPPITPGMTALEIGCGAGQNSIYLARHGATCAAFDISSEQITIGQTLAREQDVTVDFHALDMNAPWLPCSGPFDFIHATYSLPFSDDPEAVIQQVWNSLTPGGQFLLTMGHPLYAGEWMDVDDEDGVFIRSYFDPQTDLRDIPGEEDSSIGARCYPISRMFGWLRSTGFEVSRLEEPHAQDPASPDFKDVPYSSEGWESLYPVLSRIPLVVIFQCRKPG